MLDEWSGPYTTRVSASYRRLYALGISTKHWSGQRPRPDRITVRVAEFPGFEAEGAYQANGKLSGQAAVHDLYEIDGDIDLEYRLSPDGTVVEITTPLSEAKRPQVGLATPVDTESEAKLPAEAQEAQVPAAPVGDTVLDRRMLRHIHFEPFRPTNLDVWSPQTETDIYLVFGVLQESTKYEYCCGASKEVLNRLGYSLAEITKPDAILIRRASQEYVLAECKMRSKDYKPNNYDVDVLVVWEDDAAERDGLPEVIALRPIAREVARQDFEAQ